LLAFAHNDITNPVLHGLGDAAVILTLVALGVCVYALISRASRKRAVGSSLYTLASGVGVLFSFVNFHSYAVFVIASLWAFTWAIMSIAHLFKPINIALPRSLRAA
jgi:hypothetical protein